MSEEKELNMEINNPGQGIDMVQETIETFLETADVSRVYSQSHEHGNSLIIPAAEVVTGMGFGIGYGVGGSGGENGGGTAEGGGGGGKALARPVAVIIADDEGVRVEPIIDPTKILLTALTAFGFMFGTIAKMRKRK